MSTTYGHHGQKFGRWLEKFGFTDDPFELDEADREGPYLPYFFVDRPYLHDVLGDPAHPQAAFLMAGPGHGKTATREMVVYECERANLRGRALAVRYYDFGPLLEQVGNDLSRLTARHHVRAVVRHTLTALAEDVPASYFDLLDEPGRTLLASCAAAFASPVFQPELKRRVPVEPAQINWDDLSPLETLQTLAGLITQLGGSPEKRYEALYVLVDRVDETSAGPAAAVALLEPLVREGPLLETAHVAFKFFLPIEVGEGLRQTVRLRPDRLCIRTITWNEEKLRDLVQVRLKYYSEGNIARLEELCTSGAKTGVMERLVCTCEGSPRTLLRLCRALTHHHVAQADETSTLITYTELVDTLRIFTHQLEVERAHPPSAAGRATPAPPAAPPESGLFLDENGHVWVDGEMLVLPLSELEFRLLDALYQQAPEIVPREALIETVWPSSTWMGGEGKTTSDEQNLRKLIARLRERLEPGSRTPRFIKNVRGRGYWLDAG